MGRLRVIGLEAEAAMLAATWGSTRIVAPSSAWGSCARLPVPRRRVKAWHAVGRDRRPALGRGHRRRAGPAAQPWQHGAAALRCRRGTHGSRPRLSRRLRGQLPALQRGEGMLREMRRPRASKHASRSSRPWRTPISCIAAGSLDCGLRNARPVVSWGRAEWRRPTGASARGACTKASSRAVSVRAGRPIYLP